MSYPKRGDWRVTRNCCENGRCIGCRKIGRPTRTVQASGCSEEWARHVAGCWETYGARAEPMAIDRYDRVADNLAAVAATLEAMRAIKRHGGGEILERAFTGFAALPAPEQWWQILGVEYGASREEIERAHRRLAMAHHPDRGGDAERMVRINAARDVGLQAAS